MMSSTTHGIRFQADSSQEAGRRLRTIDTNDILARILYPRVRHEVQYRPYSPGFSGRAVAALLFAWLLPPLGVILAINARLDIRSSGRRGMGIAITALVMGAILTIADVAVLVTST